MYLSHQVSSFRERLQNTMVSIRLILDKKTKESIVTYAIGISELRYMEMYGLTRVGPDNRQYRNYPAGIDILPKIWSDYSARYAGYPDEMPGFKAEFYIKNI